MMDLALRGGSRGPAWAEWERGKANGGDGLGILEHSRLALCHEDDANVLSQEEPLANVKHQSLSESLSTVLVDFCPRFS